MQYLYKKVCEKCKKTYGTNRYEENYCKSCLTARANRQKNIRNVGIWKHERNV